MPNRFTWKTGDVVITKAQESAENKFNPSQPRDKDGQWSDGGGSGRSSAILSEADAIEATKNSAYKMMVFHGTTAKAAKSIEKEGFKNPEEAANGSYYGDGVYFAENRFTAQAYAKGNNAKVLSAYVDVRKPFTDGKTGDLDKMTLEYGVKNNLWSKDAVVHKKYDGTDDNAPQIKMHEFHKAREGAVAEVYKEYDAIIINTNVYGTENIVVVRDPEAVKPFKVAEPNWDL